MGCIVSLVRTRAAGKSAALPDNKAASQMDVRDYIIFAKVCEPVLV